MSFTEEENLRFKGIINKYKYKNYPIHESLKAGLSADFASFCLEYLTSEGLNLAEVKERRNQLAPMFHPDKKATFDEDRQWLIDQLGADCAASVNESYNYITNPEEFDLVAFLSKGFDDQLLELQNMQATASPNRKILYENIIALMEVMQKDHADRDPSSLTVPEKTLAILPYLASGACVVLYANQIALVYALSFVLCQSGQIVEAAVPEQWKFVGKTMQYVATQLTKLGSLIMYILGALGFIATTNIRQIATSAIQSLFSNQLLTQEAAFDTASETPKLTPLDMVYSLVKKEQAKYVESRENQWIANFRLGAIKVNHVREMFKQITEFYHAKRPVDKRLEQIENRLKELEGQEELMKSPGDLKSMIQMFLNHIQKVKEISNPRLLMPASREEQETRLGANYSEDLAAIQENYQGSPSRY